MDCIFCKINQGEVSGLMVGENAQASAFLDVNPLSKGHTLVVPKRHVETILELKTDELHTLFDLVKEATAKLQAKLKCDGFNIGANMHEAAGQAVEHLHIHLIPRWRNDGGGNMHSIIHKSPNESLEAILKQINS
jgi:histidine triad (HIT) family protein